MWVSVPTKDQKLKLMDLDVSVYTYFYYAQQVKRELKRIHICGYRYNERLMTTTDDLSASHTLSCVGTWNT